MTRFRDAYHRFSYSILVNGKSRGYIKATRGIRQGDPLSPFLFVIAMDYLTNLITEAWRKNLIQYFTPRNNNDLNTSRLLFVDDILLFSVAESEKLQNLYYILQNFQASFQLKDQLTKIKIFGTQC